MCPFVERARLALDIAGVKYQVVQINLGNRAKWHREISNGFVPILEIPGYGLLNESKDIIEFVDRLQGDEPYLDKDFKKPNFIKKDAG